MDIKFNIVRKEDGELVVERVTGERVKAGSYDTEAEATEAMGRAALGKPASEWTTGPSILEKNAFKNADLKDEINKKTKRTFKIKEPK